jgi:hypothetical protein
MNPSPTSRKDTATSSGEMETLTPSASRTSALPDFDETDRPPCLATRAPAAAATNAAVVEMLKVCDLSPPVPHVSTRCSSPAASTRVENSRITEAAAAISDTDSVFTCRPMRIAASCTCETLPSMTWRIRSTISS